MKNFYEVGKVYVWVSCAAAPNLVGMETTVTSDAKRIVSRQSGNFYIVHETDSKCSKGNIIGATKGSLRPKNPPPGEQSIRDLFKLPHLDMGSATGAAELEKIMGEWAKRREDDGGYIHMLPIEGSEAAMKVEKTRGGDYSITAMLPDDPCGGDVFYAPTLPKAKKMAEDIAASGEYEDMLLD